MDAIREVLDAYNIAYKDILKPGLFNNSDLQSLYDSLKTNGEAGLIEALMSGATVEDVDIDDLTKAISRSDNIDINKTYEFLTCGSRNHMRAFSGQIDSRGASYSPKFISRDLYKTILTAPHERCGL